MNSITKFHVDFAEYSNKNHKRLEKRKVKTDNDKSKGATTFKFCSKIISNLDAEFVVVASEDDGTYVKLGFFGMAKNIDDFRRKHEKTLEKGMQIKPLKGSASIIMECENNIDITGDFDKQEKGVEELFEKAERLYDWIENYYSDLVYLSKKQKINEEKTS